MVKNSFQLGNILEKEYKQKILLRSIIDIMIGLAKDIDNGWIVYYSCFDKSISTSVTNLLCVIVFAYHLFRAKRALTLCYTVSIQG